MQPDNATSSITGASVFFIESFKTEYIGFIGALTAKLSGQGVRGRRALAAAEYESTGWTFALELYHAAVFQLELAAELEIHRFAHANAIGFALGFDALCGIDRITPQVVTQP